MNESPSDYEGLPEEFDMVAFEAAPIDHSLANVQGTVDVTIDE